MKRGSTLFLKGVIVLIGLGVLTLCVYAIPVTIGEFDLGGYDPILLGLYVPAIPFFIALYQSMKLLGNIEHGQVFTQLSVNALKYIKRCGIAISILYAAGMPFVFPVADKDDAPGVVLIGLIIIFASLVIGIAAGLFQNLLQSAVNIKAENDLTV